VNTSKSTSKKSTGFTDEEKSRDEGSCPGTEGRSAREQGQAEGESAALAAIAAMQEPDRSMANGCMRSSKSVRQCSRRKPGMGCPRMPTKTARSSASSKLRRSSRRGTRHSVFNDTANLDEGAMWPVAFALKELTAAEEARISRLVKKQWAEN